MYDVITVGSATIDVFSKTDSELITIKTLNSQEDLIAYPSGSKILIKSLNFFVGGGGTNTAVALSRLGLKAGYLGNIGKDANGRTVADLLKKEKVDFLGTVSEDMTNYSIVLDSIGDDRTILAYKGASEKLALSRIDKHKLMANWIYLCSMDVHILDEIINFAEKNNIKIAFNPSNYLAEKGSEYIEKILKNTNLLILNDQEAELLVGKASTPILLDRLSKLGPKTVVITQGPKGAEVFHNEKIYQADALKVKVVETTGAGDAFGSSFLGGLIIKNSIDFALKLALVNSAAVVQHEGAKETLLTLKQAETLIKKSKIKIKTVNLKR